MVKIPMSLLQIYAVIMWENVIAMGWLAEVLFLVSFTQGEEQVSVLLATQHSTDSWADEQTNVISAVNLL